MLITRLAYRVLGGTLVAALALGQLGCAVDRLKQPIADFAAATSVVTAQARLAYGEINRVERIRFIKTALRLKKPIRLNELEAETTFFTPDDLATRLDALDQLDQHAKLLSQIVNSDTPEKIAASASSLETGLEGLASRIQRLADTSVVASGSAAGSTSSNHPNNARFKERFGVFAGIAREVLGLIAKKKQNDALKRAIRDGDHPVNDLIDAIRADLVAAHDLKRANLEHDITDIFKAYNTEIVKAQPDKGRLDEIAKTMIDNLEAQDAFNAADPTDALDKMKESHSKMVEYANEDSAFNLTAALASIQSFVDSAGRLGAAVIKLKSVTKESS